jgi:DNA-binding transcriptional regulator YhcF (GntR family)
MTLNLIWKLQINNTNQEEFAVIRSFRLSFQKARIKGNYQLMKELTKTAIVFSAIKEKIARGELVNGNRLPSARILAGEFDVSISTIIKVFKLLEHIKLITIVQSSGVYIGTKNNKKIKPYKIQPSKTRSEEIADSIISQITQGTLKAGEPLALKKVLVFKYATSKETIHKAIEILLEERYIHKDGFRYKIGQPTISTFRQAKNRIYILTEQKPLGWKFLDPHNKTFFLPFELELQKHGIISFEPLNFWNVPDLIHKAEETSTAGFLIDFPGLSLGPDQRKNLQTHFYKIAEVIGKKQLPLIVDNYNEILLRFPDFTFKPLPTLFFIGHDNYEPGEKAGAYLASMGHKQITYFNVGNNPGNFQLFKGVERAMKRLFNNESNIHYFHDESDDYYWNSDLSTYARTSSEKKKRFLDAYSGLFESYQFEHADPVEKVYPFLADRIYQDIFKKKMAPMFEKALQIKEITAWVGTGYTETIAAAEFLMEQKINIPNKISLFGFADGDLTSEYGITTYNFMEEKAAYLAAHCILGDIPIKKNRKGFVEYEGQIMVRKSVKAI